MLLMILIAWYLLLLNVSHHFTVCLFLLHADTPVGCLIVRVDVAHCGLYRLVSFAFVVAQ